MLILECLKAEQQPPDDAKLWKLCALSKDRGEPGLEMRLRVTVSGISPVCAQGRHDEEAGDPGWRSWRAVSCVPGHREVQPSYTVSSCSAIVFPTLEMDCGDGFGCRLVMSLVITREEARAEPVLTTRAGDTVTQMAVVPDPGHW